MKSSGFTTMASSCSCEGCIRRRRQCARARGDNIYSRLAPAVRVIVNAPRRGRRRTDLQLANVHHGLCCMAGAMSSLPAPEPDGRNVGSEMLVSPATAPRRPRSSGRPTAESRARLHACAPPPAVPALHRTTPAGFCRGPACLQVVRVQGTRPGVEQYWVARALQLF